MNFSDNIWARNVKNFVAALVALEILQRWIRLLQHRAHRTVGNYRARRKCLA